jgi:cell wall-associated NlpC family hydrolase
MPLNAAALAQSLTHRALLSVGTPSAMPVRRPFAALDDAALAELHRFAAQMLQQATAAAPPSAPTPARAAILSRAQSMLGTPYRWGGNGPDGLDCSAFVSRAWGISRHTTNTLPQVAQEISKDELQPGDALNLPTWRDGKRFGHVRLFAGWANAERTLMHVYEAAAPPGKVVYHTIPYDPAYTPLRLRTLGAA